eukprot:TRINITY_DN94484_c0_g1_i1.p1 TRINITY_DN94484_c0_g1~~TRINITY_DN94484_c0_g1_i1.p1  ORF type:complete len:594 (-),score=119.29 TRINITY_DN94484_c0_g1_i1:121-1902(-)
MQSIDEVDTELAVSQQHGVPEVSPSRDPPPSPQRDIFQAGQDVYVTPLLAAAEALQNDDQSSSASDAPLPFCKADNVQYLDEMPTPTQRERTRERMFPNLLAGEDGGGAGGSGRDGGGVGPEHLAGSRQVAAEEATLMRARALSQMVLELEAPRAPQQDSTASHVNRLREECAAARARIQSKVATVTKASEAVRTLEGHAADIEDAQSRLRHARSSRWSELVVCDRRLELLSDPSWLGGGCSHEAHDQAQASASRLRQSLVECLEIERKALLLSRRELTTMEQQLYNMQAFVSSTQTELGKHSFACRAAMRSDHATLTQTLLSREHTEAAKTPVATDGIHGWDIWTQRLASLRGEAVQLCEQTSVLIQWTDLECGKAGQAFRAQLARCVAEEEGRKRQLEAQLKDLEYAVSSTECTLKRYSRKGHDPSSAKSQKAERAKVLLHELRVTHRHLQGLVRRSLRDLQVVEACRRVTAAGAAATPRGARNGLGAPVRRPRRPSSAGYHKGLGRSRSAADARGQRSSSVGRSMSFKEDAGAGDKALDELRSLKLEEAHLKSDIRKCRDSVERCASWAAVLADLEDRVARAVQQKVESS